VQLMSESYENFCVRAILADLERHFTVEYTDDMLGSTVYYSDAATVLKENGFAVVPEVFGCTLIKGDREIMKVDQGVFAAPLVNHLMSLDPEMEGISGFPVGFSKVGAKARQGALSGYSDVVKSEVHKAGKNMVQGDQFAMEQYLSVERTDVKGEMPDMFVSHCRLADKADLMDEDEDGVPCVSLPNKVFYLVVDLGSKGAPLKPFWKRSVERAGCIWRYVQDAGVLAVSNAKAVACGLPPNAIVMGLEPLGLKLSSVTTPSASKAVASSSAKRPVEMRTVKYGVKTTGEDGLIGQETAYELLDQFIADPCEATHNALFESPAAKKYFLRINTQLKLGSNKKKATSGVRDKMVGEESSVSWQEYLDFINQEVGKDRDPVIVIVHRLGGAIRICRQTGLIHFA